MVISAIAGMYCSFRESVGKAAEETNSMVENLEQEAKKLLEEAELLLKARVDKEMRCGTKANQ